MTSEPLYRGADKNEIQLAINFVRTSPRYGHLAPPDDEPRWDWNMFRVIGDKIAEMRNPESNLAQLTGMVVRMFIPAWNKAMRILGMAYRDAWMTVFRMRKEWKRRARRKKKARAKMPPVTSGVQLILI